MFQEVYAKIETGSSNWQSLAAPGGKLYPWSNTSTYIKKPPYFDGMTRNLPTRGSIKDAKVLLYLGDSVTTDHISPAGSIGRTSPAARYTELVCGSYRLIRINVSLDTWHKTA